MQTHVVLVTLIVYQVLLLAIGFWASKRTSNTEDFFLGGRGLGPVVAAISYSASSASAWTLLGMSGASYVYGVASIWMALGAILGSIVAWWWIAPRMMRHSRERMQLTVTDFIAEDANPRQQTWIKGFASAIILLSFMLYISSQFQGAGNTFASTFNMGMASSIVLGGAIIVLYTLLGGFWAVSITDTVQGFLMLLTAILLPVAAFMAIGDWDNLLTGLHRVSSAAQLSPTAGNVGLSAAGFVAGGLAVGMGTYGQPHLLNRFMALKDASSLNQARILAIGWFSFVFLGMYATGLMGRILVAEIDNPETIFFRLTTDLFPPVFGGILLAAVLSAIMSTADSMLLVASASVSHDLQLEKRFPGKELWISRVTMLAISLIAIGIAIYLPATIFQRVLFAWIAIGSAFGPIVFVRLAGVRIAPNAVLAAMLSGFSLAVVLYWLPDTIGDVAERLVPFSVGLLILLLGRRKNLSAK
jgi:sodium/proline symporter